MIEIALIIAIRNSHIRDHYLSLFAQAHGPSVDLNCVMAITFFYDLIGFIAYRRDGMYDLWYDSPTSKIPVYYGPIPDYRLHAFVMSRGQEVNRGLTKKSKTLRPMKITSRM